MEKKQKYKVLLTRYPEEYEVEACTEKEAILIARCAGNFSVWESEVELVD